MAGLTLDFTNVSSGFEVLPAGKYEAEVVKVELKTSKAGDSQYLNFEWNVTDENGKSKKIWDIASLKPQALWKLKQIMDAVGMSTDGQIDLDLEAFEGQQAILEVAIDTYDGKEKNVVKNVLGFGSAVSTGSGI